MKHFILLFFSLLATFPLHSQEREKQTDADATFRQYYEQAITFANTYPREKAYLHFDNTSYYVGDTIWMKAYVTVAEQNTFSPISKPLYVDMLDQTGHVTQRQIIKLENGEGCGQIILDPATLSGYYEIRAYTRWMQAFEQPSYFSRVLPVYQSIEGKQKERIISTYDLNPSMKQRPKVKKKKLTIHFFPEGGSLIEGVETKIAFKAESSSKGEVYLEGDIYNKDGEKLTTIQTRHDGMGIFRYTPGKEPAIAKVHYQNKNYTFSLPEALSAGYVLNTAVTGQRIQYTVTGNHATPAEEVGVFISHEGRPYTYRMLQGDPVISKSFVFNTQGLPAGIYQISLINKTGNTLCERFCFVQPTETISMQVTGLKEVYKPFEPVECELQIMDEKGNPVKGTLSVSVCDAMHSDYAEYDNNLFTDMLLTSGLKGYIHQPGYYFADITPNKLQELDMLLMVHGWRQYDMSKLITPQPSAPLQTPETQLLLHGQIKSSILKKEMKNMEVSVMAKNKEVWAAGKTITDEYGYFHIPVSDFNGEIEALFQTGRQGAKFKKDTSVQLDRNFSPALRTYGYEEWHPQWADKSVWELQAEQTDSIWQDSIRKAEGTYMLDEVIITTKRKNKNLTTQVFEKSMDAYYDVPKCVDELRDKGKLILTIPDLLQELNSSFRYDRRNGNCTYKEKRICCILNGSVLDPVAAEMIWDEIDGIKQIIICEGSNSFTNEILNSARAVQRNRDLKPVRTFDDSFYAQADAQKESLKSQYNLYNDYNYKIKEDEIDADKKLEEKLRIFNYGINRNIDATSLDQYSLFYIIPYEKRNTLNSNQKAARGTRRTFIQGYTQPLAFYTPAYTDKAPDITTEDRRRTLYWNPATKTDENGKAVIKCYNASYSTPVIIQAETLQDGKPGSITYVSITR